VASMRFRIWLSTGTLASFERQEERPHRRFEAGHDRLNLGTCFANTLYEAFGKIGLGGRKTPPDSASVKGQTSRPTWRAAATA
jgi:hypothetical protein